MHLVVAFTAAWIAGCAAATAALWEKSGADAFQLLPSFAIVLGLWMLCVGAVARRKREMLKVGWMYRVSLVSSVLCAILFFVLFLYPFMVCIPLGMLVSAPAFHVVFRAWKKDSSDAN